MSLRPTVSSLEFGLFVPLGRRIVRFPESFCRRGNVDIVCRRHNVPMAASLEELIALVRRRIEQ